MEEQTKLPKFVEEKRYSSKQVLIARCSRDGNTTATVNHDYSISIWDSSNLLVDTYELEFFQFHDVSPSPAYRSVFLDWESSGRYLYYIVDRNGFLIDVYGTKKICKTFTFASLRVLTCRFDKVLNSFSCHPTKERLCVVTCLDKLIELDISNDNHTIVMTYRDLVKQEPNKKESIYSYAQYIGIDDLILLWLNGTIFLVDRSGQVVRSIPIKLSQPLQQRIHIDLEQRICIVACRNDLLTLSLPELEVMSSYRDSVNDSPWRSLDYFAREHIILAIPENYVLDGPVFYLITSEGDLEVSICRDPKQRLDWGIVHPSGKSILFCSEHGELIVFKREEKGFQWQGPMYPFHFVYLRKSEQGPSEVTEDFERTFFPFLKDIAQLEARPSHPIDIEKDKPTPPPPFAVELEPGEDEQEIVYNEHQLPPMMRDIYGS